MQEPSLPKKRKAKSKKPSRAKRRKVTAEILPKQPQKWLVLAGTKEARDFITEWRADSHVVMTACVGVKSVHAFELGVETRIGGFSYVGEDGGAVAGDEAMAQFITKGRYSAVIDLTDPFAAQISANAYAAAKMAGVSYFQFVRPAWKPLGDDDWHYHDSWESLYKAVKTRHLFVAAGQEALHALSPTSLAYITARMMEAPQVALSNLPENLKIIMGAPSQGAGEEEALFRKIKITAVATNLSGGKDDVGKLAAARHLGLSVHLVKRPDYPEGWFGNLKSLYRALARSLVISEEKTEE